MNKSLTTAVLLLALVATGAAAQTEVDESRDMNADGRISLRAVTGEYEILGTDENRLTITGTLGEDVEELRIDGDAGDWTVEVRHKNQDKRTWRKSSGSELTITLPRGAEVEARTVSGSLDLRDLAGSAVYVHSVSGAIELTNVSPRRLEVESVSGAQRMNTAGSEETHLKSVSGNIETEGARGRVRIKSVSGNIELTAADIDNAELETVSGRMQAGLVPTAQGRIQATSHSGSLHLALPADTELHLRASTFSGRIKSDFGGEVQRGRGPGERLEHRVGDGRVRVEAKSFSAGVEITTLD